MKRYFEYLQAYSKLYYNDFMKIVLSSYTTRKLNVKKELDFIFSHLTSDKIVDTPFLLHIYWWKYADNVWIQLQLVETFPSIFTKVQLEGSIIHGKLDQCLFIQAINLLLQKIYDEEEYEQDLDILLSLVYRINDTTNLTNLPLLLGFELAKLKPYFKYSVEPFLKHGDLALQQLSSLQQITSIAFLKEFVHKFWENYMQKNNSLSRSLVKEINDCMKNNQSFIQSLKSYFLIGIKQSDQLKNVFPWIENDTDNETTYLPRLWESTKIANFEDFYSFYDCNFVQKNSNLSLYFLDFGLGLWDNDIKEEVVNQSFPTCLLASNTNYTYAFIVNEIKRIKPQIKPQIKPDKKNYGRRQRSSR
ncbi:11993_t:CDS:2 [Funneliformis mosseae]|uniref:11993_t:CDS:1 n=1 Tax=Funneliformis mosseae TaxID=27381 RepID=A0A9N9GSW1_FUNMO|nr:11993_t:CDS:2 [Funneliformis mosseae]